MVWCSYSVQIYQVIQKYIKMLFKKPLIGIKTIQIILMSIMTHLK